MNTQPDYSALDAAHAEYRAARTEAEKQAALRKIEQERARLAPAWCGSVLKETQS